MCASCAFGHANRRKFGSFALHCGDRLQIDKRCPENQSSGPLLGITHLNGARFLLFINVYCTNLIAVISSTAVQREKRR